MPNAPASLNLLWLTEHYPPAQGGMARSCDRIVEGLRQLGVQIEVCHLSERPERVGAAPYEAQRRAGGAYRHCPVQGSPAHALNLLWAALRRDGTAYTHVVAFGGQLPVLAGPVLAPWLGAPLVTLLRGNDVDLALFNAPRRAALGEAITRAAAVVAVSDDMAWRLRRLWPGAQISWIANGIDLERWQPLPSERDRAQAWRSANAEGKRVVGLIGQLKSKKGADQLIEAIHASGAAPQLHLLLIGELDDAVRGLLGLEGPDGGRGAAPQAAQPGPAASALSFTVLPFQPPYGLIPWYLACDWVAIPSHYDGLPNVLLEAAALSIPLLASTAGGLGDVLVEGEQGLLFAPGDRHGMRKALSQAALLDEQARAALGEGALSLARALSAEREAAAYLDLLHRTLGAPAISLASAPQPPETTNG